MVSLSYLHIVLSVPLVFSLFCSEDDVFGAALTSVKTLSSLSLVWPSFCLFTSLLYNVRRRQRERERERERERKREKERLRETETEPEEKENWGSRMEAAGRVGEKKRERERGRDEK